MELPLRAGKLRNRLRFFAGEMDFFLLLNVQTGPDHPSSCKLVPGLSSPGIKLTTHLHLVPRLTMVELYLQFPNTFIT
jgi:hypothetical protein